MSEEPTDIELLQSWQGGDAEAGSRLLRRHFRTLFRFFRSKVSDGVDDLVQKTMLACSESAHRFRGESSFRTYLLAIARTQLLMHLRRYSRKGKQLDPIENSIADVLGSPSVALAAKDEQDVVLAALQHIPLDLQMTLELYYWEELKVAEIAQVLEIPLGTVKSRLNRGRRMVKEWIERDPKFEQDLREKSLEVVDSWTVQD